MIRLRNVVLALLPLVMMLPVSRAADPRQSAPVYNSSPDAGGMQLPLADHIVVRKAQRRLDLLRGSEVLRSYRVALGLQPQGHKEREGDFRTPEGRYQLTRRNPRSDYFLSIQLSYPNDGDVQKARANGWEPGGSIMIHGQPNTLKHERAWYAAHDWTDGCIALSNADMIEVWLLARNNIPIDILP
jgi:murein L,D-transpeptidase YafK